VHLTLLGKEGLREMAQQNLSKARFALVELTKIPGVRRAFDAPFFNEFTLEFPRSVKNRQRGTAPREDRRPRRARHFLSGADEARAGLRHRNHNAL